MIIVDAEKLVAQAAAEKQLYKIVADAINKELKFSMVKQTDGSVSVRIPSIAAHFKIRIENVPY